MCIIIIVLYMNYLNLDLVMIIITIIVVTKAILHIEQRQEIVSKTQTDHANETSPVMKQLVPFS